MLNRRNFLIAASGLALAQGLSGCGNQSERLEVLLLQNAIPPQLLSAFRQSKSSKDTLSFKPKSQFEDLFKLLQTWQAEPQPQSSGLDWLPFGKNSATRPANLVLLGHYWLTAAIQQALIQPLPLETLSRWDALPQAWQKLVRRNPQGEVSPTGQLWGAPYRWGSTLIVYRKDKLKALGWTPTDWKDLFREDLRDQQGIPRISLVNHPREVMGLVLKKMGYSYNTTDTSVIKAVETELRQLQRNVRLYSTQYYLHPLLLGETWVAVGWSNEILPLLKTNPNLEAVIPASGTALWTEMWVQPKRTPAVTQLHPLILEWLNFCWQPQAADLISLFTEGASPVIFNVDEEQLSKDTKENPFTFLNSDIFNESEFIIPLEPSIYQEYLQVWKTVRT